MNTMTPIETSYRGYKFRSRLEARWAVFFDHCLVKYIYEPEGFKLTSGDMYLPDFYLPEQDAYVEVKPVGAIKMKFENDEVYFDRDSMKYGQFVVDAVNAGHTVIIVQGDPMDAMTTAEHGGIGSSHVFTMTEFIDKDERVMKAYPLLAFMNNRIAVYFFHGDEVIPCNTDTFCVLLTEVDENGKITDMQYLGADQQSVCAGAINTKGGMIAARQARFEHGESGS